MESCLVIPRERPPTLSELKRALLTYDRVYLASPDDRELIPPSHFTAASSPAAFVPFSFDVGAVRPLGKVAGYDDQYQQLLDRCNDAIAQGSLIVLDPPTPSLKGQFTIGANPLPAGWPDPTMVYRSYRTMASSPEFISTISRGLDDLALQSLDELDALAPSGADDKNITHSINGQELPALPRPAAYPGVVTSEEELIVYTKLCLARLGSVVKNFIRCRDESLVPYTGDAGMASTIQLVSRNCATALRAISEGDSAREDYLRRLRVFDNLVVSEYLPEEAVEKLEIGKLLELRSKSWGREGEARRLLSARLKELSSEALKDDDFAKACRSAIEEYRKTQAALESEWAQFRLKCLCGVGLGGCGVKTGVEIAQRIFQLSDLGAVLLAGGVFFKFLKETAPDLQKILDQSKASKNLAGYALCRTYRPFSE